MDYKNIYNSLISRAKQRKCINTNEYEKHHILPRSWGGTDESFNLVYLTYKEHWLAHVLLVKIAPKEYMYKAQQALLMMGRVCETYRNGIMYSNARKAVSKYISKKHTNTIIVVDSITGIMIGRVSKEHPKVLSGQWIFFQKGKTNKELRRTYNKSHVGDNNSRYIEFDYDQLTQYCFEFFDEYGIINYNLISKYICLKHPEFSFRKNIFQLPESNFRFNEVLKVKNKLKSEIPEELFIDGERYSKFVKEVRSEMYKKYNFSEPVIVNDVDKVLELCNEFYERFGWVSYAGVRYYSLMKYNIKLNNVYKHLGLELFSKEMFMKTMNERLNIPMVFTKTSKEISKEMKMIKSGEITL